MPSPNEKPIDATSPNIDIDIETNPSEERDNNTQDSPENNDEDIIFRPWSQLPIYFALGLGVFILGFDNTIVGTATPTLTNEFHALNDIGWYGSAYRLTTCSTQFLFGKLYSQFDVKWVLVSAVIILEIGSVVSAAATSSAVFIVGRAIAGCGAAGILNGVLIAISYTVPLRLRPIFNSTVGGLECIAMIVAPVIGGALTTYVSWRWCFYINLPIGGFTLLVITFLFENPATQRITPQSALQNLKQLNIPSLSIFTGGIVCLLLALQWGGTTYPWSSARVIICLGMSAVSIAIFLGHELLRKDTATIPRSVVLNRTAGLCLIYAFASSLAFNVLDYFLPLWFQSIKGSSAASSGLSLLPSIIPLSIAAISSGFILSLVGYYTPLMLFGSAMTSIGFGFLTTFTSETGKGTWMGWQVLLATGLGLSFPMPWSVIQVVLHSDDVPMGMAGVGFCIAFGGAVSVSVAQNIFTNLLRNGLEGIHGVDVNGVIEQGATGFLDSVSSESRDVVLRVYNGAVMGCFWMGVVAAIVGFCAAVGMKWKSVRKDGGKEQTEA
ncbi:MDR family MFS transporter [Aspergillus stella-maris]|uniref:MDR family MFS transporter n=1 Tax=Aspergillus stella-maris TaxID=1810926 RepID=UPI003CCCEE05